ncbi:nuclear transport factor 2 family protein [Marininema halotolerans]|uniref:SnoaL-like domain-containing protein n=1 Tax=Marininema halotolerans TaxID=1155944 RepID=A0A1I6P7E9_9BACL|nr:nuclear transport factor 2 family protein [Marininema halotolerans]SFS36038.1 SnoaL-like domain-containing protein [Marininema halotolerans]
MNTTEHSLKEWFFNYADTYIRCARSSEEDLANLLKFFHVPLSMITDADFLMTQSQDELAQNLQAQLEQLRQLDYEDSRSTDEHFEIINNRAAWIRATWQRFNTKGEEIQRIRVTYWVNQTNQGWKITSMAIHHS